MSRPTLAIRWLTALLLLCAATLSHAQYQAGREYVRIDPPRPVATGSKLEVLEFFYYGCPICYRDRAWNARTLWRHRRHLGR